MKDIDCIRFLQWALPRMGMRWAGFRKVRRQVSKKIDRRMKELDISDVSVYQFYLGKNPEEWIHLDAMCRITISRFYRDKVVFDHLEELLFEIAENARYSGEHFIKCWSAGCASGEEPYTLALLWADRLKPHFPKVELHVTATDSDPVMIKRGEAGCYGPGSMKDLPQDLVSSGFDRVGGVNRIKSRIKERVTFFVQDIRETMPEGPFHLILCRNLAFTYFEDALQRRVLGRIKDRLLPGGALVLGIHESLPKGTTGFAEYEKHSGIFTIINNAENA